MNLSVVHSIVILGLNVIGGLLALSAFWLFLLRGDPYLAAVPAVFAAPVIVLQPWFVVFFFLPYGPFLAPFLTTAVTVPLYLYLHRKGKLDRPKLALARLGWRKALLVFGAVASLDAAYGVSRYVDFPALHKGVPSVLQYPIEKLKLSPAKPRYYGLGGFIDSEWLWQAGLSESDMDHLADELGMHTVDHSRIPDAFRRMPPFWWHPVITDRTMILSTMDFPVQERGSDGRHAFGTWSPDDQVLHMWIKDNF